ncbi:NAD(+) diphosphatase [Parendozoicomonas haliclonae]|uniref:NAD(+) diphosphatase n=1 Tax=Parendozoicomonas haliclonae TaxID=1960125 RepID=A0A1X7APE7_9GAMM|nr:NAD(+) diphosphatase [Parendozoicomonas haliclonae]SMA49130.1 NADH pyrophosphatase [Parendozoicomonas haliclonae]
MTDSQVSPQWLIFAGGRILPTAPGVYLWSSLPAGCDDIRQRHPLGYAASDHAKGGVVAVEVNLPDDLYEQTVPVRQAIIDDSVQGFLLHQAASLVNWGRSQKCCSRCGEALKESERVDDRARICPSCDYRSYPVVSPCVIVLIHRDEEILLAQGVRHPAGFFSLIAGFVEPGETLEQAVAREVKEETGLDVTDIQYRNSQPWPFSHNLMVGFTARYAGGELTLDPEEILQADWFPLHKLPQLPPPQTIARRLVDDYIATRVMASEDADKT